MTETRIPEGWGECPAEHLQAVLESEPAQFSNRFPSDETPYDSSGDWEIVRFEAKGSSSVVSETPCADLVWQEVTEFARDQQGQAIARPRKQGSWVAKPGYEGKDICLYCGELLENEQGESLRLGWGCCFCGCA